MTKLQQAIDAHRKNDIQRAKQLYTEILQSEPDNPVAMHYHGLIDAQGNLDIGVHWMEKSLSLQPNNPYFHHNIAGIYSRNGLVENAIHHFKKAIELKPDYGEAYQGLTESRSCENDFELLEKIENQLCSDYLPSLQTCYLHFAAAKIYADSMKYDAAFIHYLNANQSRKATFDVAKNTRETQNSISYFTTEWFAARKEFGLYSHTPIFIVGMPRSGTTLTEQILSSHSQVFGAGELGDIASIISALRVTTKHKREYPMFLSETTEMDLLGFGSSYLQKLRRLSNNMPRVIDKQPLNFKHIGLILLMFPNAKIIHTTRDPIDTCLSCFFQNFSNGQYYSFNLENLSAFYNNYQALMKHWHSIFPQKIYSLSYEGLVADQESATRDLLNFCDLPWEKECLSFHQNERQVTTASKFQVRQALYTGSLKRWQHYEKHLQPLIKGLKSIQESHKSDCKD
jgi:tetratricopeptide (TPR) repeat protein